MSYLSIRALNCFLSVIGVILIVLAITNIFPYQYAALLEWLGVFCLMNGFTYLYSSWMTTLLAFTAFLFGTIMDPIIVGGQSIWTWTYANALVFVFALAGTCTNVFVTRFATFHKVRT